MVKKSNAGIQDNSSRIPYHRIPYPKVRRSCLLLPVKKLFPCPIFCNSLGVLFCSIHHTNQKASWKLHNSAIPVPICVTSVISFSP